MSAATDDRKRAQDAAREYARWSSAALGEIPPADRYEAWVAFLDRMLEEYLVQVPEPRPLLVATRPRDRRFWVLAMRPESLRERDVAP